MNKRSENMEDIHKTLDSVIQGLKQDKSVIIKKITGFLDIDYALNQISKDSLITIAARPAMGKTSFILNMVINLACIENKSVVIFSLENSKEQLVNRMISNIAQIDFNKLKNANLNNNDWNKISYNIEKLSQAKIFIDDTIGIEIEKIEEKCKKLLEEKSIDIIIIDYLQLINKNDNTIQSLKCLSKELNIPIIVVSQLSRKPEERYKRGEDPRPILNDLFPEIINESDVIMFIYRDSYYNSNSKEYDIAEINIAKNRYGNTGIVKMKYQSKYLKYEEIE